jgi:hypothetical protein
MHRFLTLVLLTASGAAAQSIVDPARFTPAMLDFDGGFHDQSLQCDVTPIRPGLNFSFRFQAGYVVRVPMSQYSGRGHLWFMLARVTPEAGDRKPVYLGARMRLPEIPPTKVEWEVGGGFLLGEGRYQVAWKMFDDAGRVCRKNWRIDARLTRSERKVIVALPPDTVAEFSLRGAPLTKRTEDDAPRIRLTVLMHAAPVSPRRTRLGARDRVMLLGTLSSLLDRLPVRSVRLVVFNLDQQKELYRQENFVARSLDQVAQSINAVELGTVDYQVLQNRGGHLDLLADLIHGELTAKTPSDVVLFLGPMARFSDKLPSEELEKAPGAPRFYYLQYRPNFPQPSSFPDVITHAVAKLKGKTLVIHSPGDFAKAIDQVERK